MSKNYKKALALLLAVICCFSLFAGCGNSNTPAPAPAATPAPADNNAPADSSAPADNDTPAEPAVDYGPSLALTMGTTGAAEDISTKAAQYFCDIVNEKSGGNITIELFPNSQLGNTTALMEMTAAGSVDFFLEGNLLGSNGVPDSQAITPMLSSTSKEAFRNLTESQLYADLKDAFLEKTGVRVIANNWYRNPTAIIANKKLTCLEDCQGFKVRVPNVATSLQIFNYLGFNATPVAYNESLLSMQQGIIDGIWCTEDAIWSMGFYEVGDYVLELNLAADCMLVYACNARLESMTEAQRELIIACAQEAGEYYSGLSEDILAENRANWEAAGVETITLDETERVRWIEKLHEVAYQMEADGLWSEGYYDKVVEATQGK